jgi:protein-S-isoprenylcysteine O-methyltransferase Ste14
VEMKPLHRKIIYVILWYVVYPQLWYLYFIPELFYDPGNRLFLAAVLITYLVGVVDTYFRPFSESIRGDLRTNPAYNAILLGLFIFNPLLVILAFNENRLLVAGSLPLWDSPIVAYTGLLLLVVGGAVTLVGRAQLARFGSGVLHIEEDHRLITTGVFRLVRHPIYAGGVLGVVGFYMAFRSVVMLVLISLLYFIVVRHRLLFEEGMLIEEFGDEYREYMKGTKRLIPYIY